MAIPTVTALDPASGPAGTLVTITGTGFTEDTSAVMFGAVSAGTRFSVVSGTQMTAYAPAGTGTVSVKVTTPGGAGSVGSNFTYDAYVGPPAGGGGSAPTVTSVVPATAVDNDGGDAVVVSGTGFTTALAVYFGAAQANFTVTSDTALAVVTPAGSGVVDVTVVSAYGISANTAADNFTYPLGAVPTVTAVSPAGGYAGTKVTITGTGFTTAHAVLFGAESAPFSVDSDTAITAYAPDSTGAVHVTVDNAGGTSPTSSADLFTYGDGALPVTTATNVQSSGYTGWSASAITVTLTASANGGYGIAKTYYVVDNGGMTVYSGPFVVSGAGSHLVRWWSVDVRGNVEPPQSGYVNILSASAVPTGLTAVAVGVNQVLLSWDTVVSITPVTYRVYTGATTSPVTLVDATNACVLLVKQLVSAGAMYFAVSTVDTAGGESAKCTAAGPVTALQIQTIDVAAAAIDMAKFASGIVPPRVGGVLPTLPDATYPIGSTFYLTTDNKLYKTQTGLVGSWLPVVNTIDLSGTIGSTQIAAGAVGSTAIASAILDSITNAQSTASNAATAAQTAQTTADGKNKILFSASDASGTNYATGDVWFKRTAGIIVAQWEFTAGAWASRTLDNAVIANLNAGKLTAGYISTERIDIGTIVTTQLADEAVPGAVLELNAARADKGFVPGRNYSENIIPKMASNTAPSGVASADSDYGAEYAAWTAFDGDPDTFWMAVGPPSGVGWLQYQFSTARVIAQYAITPRNSTIYGREPTAWTFKGSNDGSTWVTLDTRTNITAWTQGGRRLFQVSNAVAYRYYRLDITDCLDDKYVTVASLEMFESPVREWFDTSGHGNHGVLSGFDFIEYPAGLNYLPNPSFEVDSDADGLADDWGIIDSVLGTPVLSRVPSLTGNGSFAQRHYYVGEAGESGAAVSRLYKIIAGIASPGDAFTISFTATGVLTGCSFYSEFTNQAWGGTVVSTRHMLSATPTRYSVNWTADAAATGMIIDLFGQEIGSGDVCDFTIDDVLVEKTSSVNPYFDGNTHDCSWSGTPNASTSLRPAGWVNSGWSGKGSTAEPYELMFDGSDRVSTSLTGLDENSVTLEAWVRHTATNASRGVLCLGTYGGLFDWYDGLLCAVVWGTGGPGYKAVIAGFPVNDGAPHHMIMTVGAQYMRLYIDGVYQGQTDISTGFVPNATQAVEVGSRAGAELWSGATMGARVYPFALTAEQVAQNFKSGYTRQPAKEIQVSSVRIADGAITADKVAANTITANQIAANAIGATEIAAGAITTAKLVVVGSAGDCLNADPMLQDITQWENPYNISIATITDAPVGSRVWQTANGVGSWVSEYTMIPVDPNKTYVVRFWHRASTISGWLYGAVRWFDGAGAFLSENYIPNGIGGTTAWTEYVNVRVPGSIPVGARYARVRMYINWGSSPAGVHQFCYLRFSEKLPGSLIVDGSISATQIAAGAITAGMLTINSSSTFGSGYDPSAAAAAALAAQGDATSALNKLTDIASDSLLTPDEKPSVIQDRDVLVAEQAGIDAQAVTFTCTAVDAAKVTYDNAVTALVAYLATLTSAVLWSSLAGNTTIVGATFRTKFNDVYASRQVLLNAIALRAKTLADSAQSNLTTLTNNLGDMAYEDVVTKTKLDGATIIEGGYLKTGFVDASRIDTGYLAAARIDANTITTGMLSAGLITADKMGVNSVFAKNLVVTDFENLIPNSNSELDPTGKSVLITSADIEFRGVTSTNPYRGTRCRKVDGAGTGVPVSFALCAPVPCADGDQFHIKAMARCGTDGGAYGIGVAIGGLDASLAWVAGGVSAYRASTTYGAVSFDYTVATSTVVYVQAYLICYLASGNSAYVDDMLFRKKLAGSLVVDGTITAAKIAALTITAAEIAANTITAAKIAALTITAAEIAAGTITAAKLNVADVQAGIVTAAAVNAVNITAANITGGAISGTTITGGTIRTAESGKRIELSTGFLDTLKFWSGAAVETSPANIVVSGGASVVGLDIYGPNYSGRTSAISLWSNASSSNIGLTASVITLSGAASVSGNLTVSGSVKPYNDFVSGTSDDGIFCQDAYTTTKRCKIYYNSSNKRFGVYDDAGNAHYITLS